MATPSHHKEKISSIPELLINVDLGGGKSIAIPLKKNDDIDSIIVNFGKIYSLKKEKIDLLQHKCRDIWNQYNTAIEGA